MPCSWFSFCRFRFNPIGTVFKANWTVLVLAGIVLLSCLNYGSLEDIVAVRSSRTAIDGDLFRYSRNLILFTAVGVLAAVSAMTFFPRLRTPHWSFFLCVCLVGPAYILVISPFSVPDEPFHYRQSLVHAAAWAHVDTLDRSYLLPSVPTHVNTVRGCLLARQVFEKSGSSGDTFPVSDLQKTGNAVQHLFQILALFIGLKGQLAPATCFYLGRFFALFFYAVFVAMAIRLTPVLKECLAVVALTPIALHQAVSYSYDSETLLFSFLAFGIAMNLANDTGKAIALKTQIVVAAAIALGLAAKCAAAPFLPLLFAIPSTRFADGIRGKVRFLAFLCILVALAVPLALSVSPNAVHHFAFGTTRDGSAAWSFSSLCLHPLRLGHIVLNEMDRNGISLCLCSFGYLLSGLSMKIHVLYPLCFMVLFVVAARHESRDVPKPLRIAAAIGFLGLSLYLVLLMLTTWTPANQTVVQGLQGRYWTPVLPLFACTALVHSAPCRVAHSQDIHGRDGSTTRLFAALLLLHLAVIVFVVKYTLRNGA